MPLPFVAVIGAVNVDIWGRSFAPLVDYDSNPGVIRTSFGGVGRNIAHNLRLLGVPVEMLTALGSDDAALRIEKDCQSLGIGLSRAIRVPGGRTSSYLYITGPNGELSLAVCDADIARQITPDVIAQNLDLLNSAALIVLDGNLTEETIGFITKRCTVPLFADPVSVTKAAKLKPFLQHIHTIKPNRQEAALLTGEEDPQRSAISLVARGVRRAYVSCGRFGIFAADEEGLHRIPCCHAQTLNATGCGDAAMAALCKRMIDGKSIEDSARYAAAAGAIAAESEQTISPMLCDTEIQKRLREIGG